MTFWHALAAFSGFCFGVAAGVAVVVWLANTWRRS
jgi:hypothetical protein